MAIPAVWFLHCSLCLQLTVAAIYGKLLAEVGLLSKGDVILKNPSDFVGDVLGSSEKQTQAGAKGSK